MDLLVLGGILVTGLIAIVTTIWLLPLAVMAALAVAADAG